MTFFEKIIGQHIDIMQAVSDQLGPDVAKVGQVITDAYRSGNKVLFMGNGGSAADAQHFAAELVGRFMMERRALPAVALTTDSSILTAVGNDYGFDSVFARQVEALGQPGDVLFGISTSGNSTNLIHAFNKAREMGLKTIALLGRDGGAIKPLVDLDITVPATATPRIQEAQLTIIHVLCELVEKQLFGD